MRSRIAAPVLLVFAALTAAPAAAQQQEEELRPPVVFAGIQAEYARPVGDFRDFVEHGFGLNLDIVWPVTTESPIALRADGGFIVYGSEDRRACFGGGVGCLIELDINTTNSIAYLNVGPQLMVPRGAIRPYINAGAGFSYFATTSSVEGSNNDDDFASTTNFDDITFTWAAGGGTLISLSSGRTPVLLDLSVRYNSSNEVEYLKEGDIELNDDGTLNFTPTRSEADLLTFQIGVSIGIRPGLNGSAP